MNARTSLTLARMALWPVYRRDVARASADQDLAVWDSVRARDSWSLAAIRRVLTVIAGARLQTCPARREPDRYTRKMSLHRKTSQIANPQRRNLAIVAHVDHGKTTLV